MQNFFRKITLIINLQEKKKLLLLIFIGFLSALMQTFSLYLFFLIININLGVANDLKFIKFYEIFKSENQFMVFTIFIWFLSLVLSNINVIGNAKLSNTIGKKIKENIFKKILFSNYLKLQNFNSNYFINLITIEVIRFQSGVIMSLVNLISRFFLIIFLLLFLLIYETKITIFSSIILLIIYSIVILFLKKRQFKNSQTISSSNIRKISLIKSSIYSFKEILLYNVQDYFIDKFKNSAENFKLANSFNLSSSELPKYYIEFLIFVGIFFSILYLLSSNTNLENTISTLSIFGLSAIKILPGINTIYVSQSVIRSNYNSVDSILNFYKNFENQPNALINKNFDLSKIEYKNLFFSYKNENKILNNLSLEINPKSRIAIYGNSGTGKSTLINILIGVIKPNNGDISIFVSNKEKINGKYLSNFFSIVEQNSRILEGDVVDNIAFGVNKKKVNFDKIVSVLKMVNMYDYFERNVDKLNTNLSEFGDRLSGGQSKRIAIARALYQDKPVIILDEPTNGLDEFNAQSIIKNILSLNKAIVMISHDEKFVKLFNEIYKLENFKLNMNKKQF